MKLIDLFSGIGGFSLAARWMGWETVAFCEQDAFCQKVLRKNFDNSIPIYDDVRTFPGESFRGADILTGGFPCQPFSAAGKRKGRDDERHLFPAMLDVIRDVQPSWVVAENVRGLLSIESGRVFAEVISSLESEGFEVTTFCIPASALGAPHRRDRLWIIGHAHQHQSGAIAGDNAEVCGLPETKRESEHGAALPIGADRDAPDAERSERRPNTKVATRGKQAAVVARNGGRDASHSDKSRLQGNTTERAIPRRGTPTGHGGSSDRNTWGDRNWIEVAAEFCRVDDVVPNRVDRLKSLGNSVVPLIPYEIFRAIEKSMTADLDAKTSG